LTVVSHPQLHPPTQSFPYSADHFTSSIHSQENFPRWPPNASSRVPSPQPCEHGHIPSRPPKRHTNPHGKLPIQPRPKTQRSPHQNLPLRLQRRRRPNHGNHPILALQVPQHPRTRFLRLHPSHWHNSILLPNRPESRHASLRLHPDQVFRHGRGTLAEYVVLPSNTVMPIPTNMPPAKPTSNRATLSSSTAAAAGWALSSCKSCARPSVPRAT
jgi:hypothetical protein